MLEILATILLRFLGPSESQVTWLAIGKVKTMHGLVHAWNIYRRALMTFPLKHQEHSNSACKIWKEREYENADDLNRLTRNFAPDSNNKAPWKLCYIIVDTCIAKASSSFICSGSCWNLQAHDFEMVLNSSNAGSQLDSLKQLLSADWAATWYLRRKIQVQNKFANTHHFVLARIEQSQSEPIMNNYNRLERSRMTLADFYVVMA